MDITFKAQPSVNGQVNPDGQKDAVRFYQSSVADAVTVVMKPGNVGLRLKRKQVRQLRDKLNQWLGDVE